MLVLLLDNILRSDNKLLKIVCTRNRKKGIQHVVGYVTHPLAPKPSFCKES